MSPGKLHVARRFLVLLLMGSVASASSPVGSEARAKEILRELHLTALPKESGYLGLIGTSAIKANFEGKQLAVQSQVYYMLTEELPINYLHWLAPDDTHVLVEGGPVDYYMFHPDGKVELQTLGMDLEQGQRRQTGSGGGVFQHPLRHRGGLPGLQPGFLQDGATRHSRNRRRLHADRSQGQAGQRSCFMAKP